MVLNNGRIVEFDSPNVLLSNKNSEFYSMAKSAGLIEWVSWVFLDDLFGLEFFNK